MITLPVAGTGSGWITGVRELQDQE